ncbi:MAG: hypothetical protein KKD44_20375 [Proteobacteria bacterium]|nr:hypothetical protein [Pseudomonadota bacterium]
MSDKLTKEPSVFIQFAGQGVKYMEDLRRMYTTCPDIRPFIHASIAEIKAQASLYDDSQTHFFTKGLDVDVWIEKPETTPELSYLLSSPLSHPLISLTQMASYMSALTEGIDQDRLLAQTHSATGFSTGIVAAILVSMGLPYDDLCRMAIKVQAMFFWQGVRCQESMLTFGVNPKLVTELYHSVEGSPSCMASITNLTRSKLETAIHSFSGNGNCNIYPAYELFPGRWIVSGLPDDLSVLNQYLKKEEAQATWRYIPSTIGAHSPFLAHAYETSPRDAKRLGLSFNGKDMKIPVLSNDKGEDLRALDDIIDEVMRAYFLCPAIWRKQISPILPPTKIRYVLDFGPGTGVASLTENHSASSGIQVVRCSIPLGRKKLMEEIRPQLGL